MDVAHVAALANLPLTPSEHQKFATQMAQTLDTIAIINELDTANVEPTSQVTGLTNITREDVIDQTRILPQSLAISQAHQTQNGYIVVPAVLDA